MSAETLHNLEISAIVLSSLSGLFGIYLVLFVLAIWSTHRQGTVTSKRLRWVTIALFVDLLIHFIVRALQFARARLQQDTEEELARWTIPMTFLGNITTTISGLLSDGTLAWRFYIIFGRQKWALYIPAAAVAVNVLFCWSADFQHLAFYDHREEYETKLLPATLYITVAWGWSMFITNSLMTGAIIYKIAWANNTMQNLRGPNMVAPHSRYATALRAIVESAFVTWIGIVLCEIGLLGPSHGHITTNENMGYVIVEIIPIFFGISQSLIIARLGLLREARGDTNEYYMSQQSDRRPSRYKPTTFSVNVSTHTEYAEDSQSEAVEVKTEQVQMV